jgi:hypothetical protein
LLRRTRYVTLNVSVVVNEKFINMYKEAAVAYYRTVYQNLLEGMPAEKTKIQSGYHVASTPGPPKYKVEM